MKAIAHILLLFIFLVTFSFADDSKKYCGSVAQPCLAYGAHVFQEHCTLCHGSDGLGYGILPMQIRGYPNTNLLKSKSKNYLTILNDIRFGGSLPSLSLEMPPWGDDLTMTELESVTSFVMLLKLRKEKALKLLRKEARMVKPSIRVGRGIYKGRCVLCHGKDGKGDGKMAKIIKDPPPSNLTLSRAYDDYLINIIKRGGRGVDRSPRMPPWGADLSDTEISSVILYIKKLRK